LVLSDFCEGENMEKKLKVITVFGTRPEAIKMAPLVIELQKHSQIITKVLVTAQHREMLDQVLETFNINPDYDLNIMQGGQTLSGITVRALEGVERVLQKERPDIVMVHGDTTTTFAASLAAYYQQVSIGHVEAGLRTYNKYSPYPEEMNRELTGILADLHFAPTTWAKENLLREGKREERVFITGNTVIDALKRTVRDDYFHPVLSKIEDKKLVLVTAHRRENWDKLTNIFRAIHRLVENNPDIVVIYPVHLNPLVKEKAEEVLAGHERIHLIPPLDVFDFHNFEARAHLILSDSGGVQEEAPHFGVPVLVMRDTTERPEGVLANTLQLVGTEEETIYNAAQKLLTDKKAYEKMNKAVNPYGDGLASKRIVEALLYHFGLSSKYPDQFNTY